MFQPGDGFLHFVFANDDQYCLPSLMRLSRQEYLRYLLEKSGFRKILFCRNADDFEIEAPNAVSDSSLDEALPWHWPFGKPGPSNQSPGRKLRSLSAKDCIATILKLFEKNQDLAMVLELSTMNELYHFDRRLVSGLIQKQLQHTMGRNILVLQSSCSAGDSHDIFMDPCGPFSEEVSGRTLCPELSRILASPVANPLYESLRKDMGSRVCFFNRFTPDRLLPLLHRIQLSDTGLVLSPKQERYIAEYLCCWYCSPGFRRNSPLRMTPNPRCSFRLLAQDLQLPRIRESLKALADAGMPLPACPAQICMYPDNTVFEHLFGMKLPSEATPYTAEFDEIQMFFSRSWNRSWSGELKDNIHKCLQLFDSLLCEEPDILPLIRNAGLVADEKVLTTVYKYLADDLDFRATRASLRKSCETSSRQLEKWQTNVSSIQTRIADWEAQGYEPGDPELQPLIDDEALGLTAIRNLEHVLALQQSHLKVLEASITEIEGPMLAAGFKTAALRNIDVDKLKFDIQTSRQTLEDNLHQYDRITTILQGSPLDQLSVPQRTRLREEYSKEESERRFHEIRNRMCN